MTTQTQQAFPVLQQFFPRTHLLISRFFPRDDVSRLMDVFAYRHHNKRFEVYHVVETQLAQISTIEMQQLVAQIDIWRHNIIEDPENYRSFTGPVYQEILHHFVISTICQDM